MSGRGGSRRATGANTLPVQTGGAFGNKPSFDNYGSSGDAQVNQQEAKPAFGSGGFTNNPQQQQGDKPAFGSGGFGNNNPQQAAKPAFGSGGFTNNQQQQGAKPAFGNGGFGNNSQQQSFGGGAQQQSTQSFGNNRFGQQGFEPPKAGFNDQQQNTRSFGNNRFGSNGQQDGQSTGNRFNQGNKPASFATQAKDDQNVEGQEQQQEKGDGRVGRIGGYIPTVRDVDAIYKEDEQSKDLYSTVFQSDSAVVVQGGGVVTCLDKWTDIKLNDQIMENIKKAGYVHPRKIQAYSIPLILEGLDMKSQAETGSGKSAAFLIPLIHKIIEDKESSPKTGLKNTPFALIIEPTRELTLQLYEQARKLAYKTGVQVVKCYGQYDMTSNGREVLMGCDIVVATPGRLLDFVKKGIIDVSNLKYFVLDEADRLISAPDFLQVVQDIRGVSTFPDKAKIQNLLFSATFPTAVEELAKTLLKENFVFVHNERTLAANSKVEQTFVECPSEQKKIKVLDILQEELKNVQSKDEKASQPRTLVFVQKRSDADLMALFLSDQGICATTINGDRPQRERERALDQFRSNTTPVLVATDVCARGLDIKDLDFVINMDLPSDIETFVHRIGRTGRLKEGKATSLFDISTDQRLAADLVKLLEEGKKCEVPEFLRTASSSTENAGGFGGGGKRFGSQAQQSDQQGFGSNTGGGFGEKRFGSQAQQSNTGFGEKRFGSQAQPSSNGFGEKRFGAQQASTDGFGGKGFGSQPASGFGSQATGGFGSQAAGGFGSQAAGGFGSQAAGGFGSQAQQPSGSGTMNF